MLSGFYRKSVFTHMRKKYGFAYKKYAYACKILTLVSLFYIVFYWTCVYTHAYFSRAFFWRLTKNKIRTRYAYFSGIYKETFLRCDTTRILSIAIETFNPGSIPTKIWTFIFTQT